MTRFILTILIIFAPFNINNLNSSFAYTPKVYARSTEQVQYDSVETFNVTATIYYPTGNPTASTKRIPSNYTMDTHRWCALSRNLLTRWGGEFDYGDTIVVEGIHEDVDGIFIVNDAINQRYNNRIDILIKPTNKLYGKWQNVTISKYEGTRINADRGV